MYNEVTLPNHHTHVTVPLFPNYFFHNNQNTLYCTVSLAPLSHFCFPFTFVYKPNLNSVATREQLSSTLTLV